MVNNGDFAIRLKKIIAYYDENASSFAEKIGVQRSSISHVLSGRNKPSLDFIMKVLNAYPEVNMYWLLNGKGQFPSEKDTSTANPITEQNLEFDSAKPKDPPLKLPLTTHYQEIDRIVIFFKDGSFKSYQ